MPISTLEMWENLGRVAFFSMVWSPFIPFRVCESKQSMHLCASGSTTRVSITGTGKMHIIAQIISGLLKVLEVELTNFVLNEIIVGEPMLSFSEQDMCFS